MPGASHWNVLITVWSAVASGRLVSWSHFRDKIRWDVRRSIIDVQSNHTSLVPIIWYVQQIMPLSKACLQGRFHEPVNHVDERKKLETNAWWPKKKSDWQDQINWLAYQYFVFPLIDGRPNDIVCTICISFVGHQNGAYLNSLAPIWSLDQALNVSYFVARWYWRFRGNAKI